MIRTYHPLGESGSAFLLVLVFAACLWLPSPMMAVETTRLIQRTPRAFRDASFEAVKITDDGVLRLASARSKIADLDDIIIWDMVWDGDDTVYLAMGNEGRLNKVSLKTGQVVPLGDFESLQVTALVRMPDGTVLAGTSPEGMIFRVGGSDVPELVLDLDADYIWDLEVDDRGRLLVATGLPGAVLRVDSSWKATTLIETDQDHVLCLAWDREGALLAGTANDGYVYRLPSRGDLEVIFDAPGEEVKGVDVLPDGSLAVLSLGSSGNGEPDTPLARILAQGGDEGQDDQGAWETAVFHLRRGRPPALLWRARGLAGHSLSHLGDDVLIGIGRRGRVLAIDPEGVGSLAAELSGREVSALIAGPRGSVLGAVSHPAALYRILPTPASTGRVTSGVIDSGIFAHWGRIDLTTALPMDGKVVIETRSGNTSEPDDTWSPWRKMKGAIKSPDARYLQYRLSFFAGRGRGPEVRAVSIWYLPLNSAPKLESLQLLDPGVRIDLKEQFAGEPPPRGINRPAPEPERPQQKERLDPGIQGIRWRASDPDGDELRYSVKLREVGSVSWRSLKTGLKDEFINLNTYSLPDGWYEVQVVVSDEASNLEGEAQRDQRISPAFAVDHAAPIVKRLKAGRDGSALVVRARVEDAVSTIRSVRFSVDGGDFRAIFPKDRVYDEKKESFEFAVGSLRSGPHTIVLKVEDWVMNVATASISVDIP